jgi:transposase
MNSVVRVNSSWIFADELARIRLAPDARAAQNKKAASLVKMKFQGKHFNQQREAGLVPSTYSSGGRTVNSRIIKQGNKLLRWAFIEAVVPAVSNNEEFRYEYDQLRERMNWNKAKVVMERKLLTIAYSV